MLVGIDYSMTCPGVTIYTGAVEKWSPADCEFYFFMDPGKNSKGEYNQKKADRLLVNIENKIIGLPLPHWTTDAERFDHISNFIIAAILRKKVPPSEVHIALEDYAMGAKGAVFNIGENTGVLKHKLYRHGFASPRLFAPTSVKLFACQHGHADKDMMHNQFKIDTGIDMDALVMPLVKPDRKKNEVESPVGDMVDSYFICAKLHLEILKNHAHGNRPNQDE